MTEAVRSTFGRLPDGREVPAVTLANARGVSATLIGYGASIQALLLPDAAGAVADVTLGYPTIADYLSKPQYFGATVGRYANRIAGGRFTLDGREYQLPLNNGSNSLHGGTTGFDKLLWEVTAVSSGPTASVTMRLLSPDGDQGYPGALTVDATYSLDEADRFMIEYCATTDAPTIVNITNHAYWDLAGEGRPVAGTPFDFREARAVGSHARENDEQIGFGRGYDHNWIVGEAVTDDLHLMASVREPVSGRGFDLLSNQPGLQFYSGNFLDATTCGKAGRLYRQGDAIVLEPQLFPDTPNQPDFGSARLAPGEVYRNTIVYQFTCR